MGQDIHIGVRAVEVGEDERCMVERKCRAVSARALSMFRLQVEEIMFDHEIEKLSALLREFAVHLLSLTDQVFLITDRDRISVRGGQGLIVIIKMLDAECLFLALIELLRSRDNDLPHLFPEHFQVFRRIVETAAAQISHRDKALKSELFRHSGAHLHETVIDFVELRGDPRIELRPRLKRRFSLSAVRTLHVF